MNFITSFSHLKTCCLLLGLAVFTSINLQAQTTLGLGDIAITGYNSDAPDGFSFVLLKDVDVSTEVSFTDRGWFASGGFRNIFNGNSVEGVVTLTFTSAKSCGTEFSVVADNLPGSSWSLSGGSGANVSTSGELALSTSGDQLFAFQGTTTSPTLITGIHSNGNWDSDATSSNTSAKPANFITGTNSLFIGVDGTPSDEQNNGQYNCTVTGTDAATIRSAVNDVSKWATNNGSAYDLSDSEFCGFSCGAVCTDPTTPTLSGTTTINVGQSTTLSVTGGNLNDGDNWVWYSGSGCSGTPIGTGASINVSPAFTTQYYARGEGSGDCNVFGPCSSAVTVTVNTPSAETLAPGDIAFVGLNSNGGSEADQFSFILLRDIAIGTDINFTDCGWDDGTSSFMCLGSSATADNGFFTWRATSTLTCGTIITISTFQGSTTPTANTGVIQGANMVLSNIGDQVFAYQGSFGSPFFIAGIHYNVTGGTTAANWDGDVTDGTTSELPDGLANGVNAVWLYIPGPTEQDNFSIICDSIGSGTVNASSVRDKINNDLDNWFYNNSFPFPLPPACSFTVDCSAPVCVEPTLPSAIGGGSGYCLSELPITLAFDDVNDANLGDATQWIWYEGGCGSGTPVGTGTSIQVSPIVPTTYFVRGEGGCVTPGACASVSVVVSGCGTNLSVGDLAFTGVNSNSPDGFSFVLLRDIISGTEINFTDCGWDDTNGFDCSFAGDNGYFTWRATTAMTCGEEVVINTNDGTSTPTPSTGIVFGSNMSLTIGGDQIFAFQNSFSFPSFKAGIHYNNIGGITSAANWDGGVTNGSTSALPNPLTNGVNAVWVYAPGVVERDNMIVDCSAFSGVSGDDDTRLAINDVNNWLTQDGTPYTLPPNCGFSCCEAPSISSVTSDVDNTCPGDPINLTVSGTLGSATSWEWYSGSCGGTSAGSGSTIAVTPTSTTTYYVRGEGGCVGSSENCQSITITVDNSPPVITCPANTTIECNESTAPSNTGSATATDNCDPSVTPTFNDIVDPGSCPQAAIITRTWTATNDYGNSSTCIQTITVDDSTPPTALCDNTHTVMLDGSGNGSIVPTDIDNGSFDNCDVSVGRSLSQSTFDCDDVGTSTVILTVTDDCGNSSTCSTMVTVEDNVAPTALCKNVTLQLGEFGNVDLSPGQIDDGSNDACGISSLFATPNGFSCGAIALNPIETVLIVTDDNGNTSTCTATVTVEDNVDPTASCQDVTVQLDASGNGSTSAQAVDNGSDDACGVDDLSLSQTDFDCDDVGANSVTLTVTDVNGNSSTCGATVTVEDNVDPVAQCEDIEIYLGQGGNISIVGSEIDNGSSDACGILSLFPIPNNFSADGTFPVILTVTDNNGNTNTCTSTVTVNQRPTTLMNTGVFTGQFGETVSLGVSLTDDLTGDPVSGKLITTSLGSQNTGSTTGSAGTGTASLTLNQEPGNYTLTSSFDIADTDGIYDTSTDSDPFTITKAPTTLTNLGSSSGQYSDEVTICAQLTSNVTGQPLENQDITFNFSGLSSLSDDTDASGIACVTIKLEQAPGNYTVASSFSGDDFYLGSNASSGFIIEQENAIITYTGPYLISTSGQNSGEATITISFTLQDINDGANNRGDITNACVNLIDNETNMTIASGLPVILIDPSDPTVGSVVYEWTGIDIGNADSDEFEIKIEVDCYYTGTETEMVTVSKPLNNFITGGGYLLLQNSFGTYAGDAGTKLNFSVNVKFNPSGNKPKGRVQFLVRRLESDGIVHLYRFRSNKLTSLAINPDNNTASITGKLNIQDITDPTNPISVGGNKIFQVTLQDNGEPGFGDVIGFTVFNNGGGLIFSSNWSGVNTLEQTLAGGNIKVHTMGNNQIIIGNPWEALAEANLSTEDLLQPQLTLFPNPANHNVWMDFIVEKEEQLTVQLIGLDGSIVRTEQIGTVKGRNTREMDIDGLSPGIYWIRISGEDLLMMERFVRIKD